MGKKIRHTNTKYTIGRIFNDYQLLERVDIGISSQYRYKLKCLVCGRTHILRASTLSSLWGCSHASCARVLGKSFNVIEKQFYSLWRSTFGRTYGPIEFPNLIDFYDMFYDTYKSFKESFPTVNTISLIKYNPNKPYSLENCAFVDNKHIRHSSWYYYIHDNGKIEYFNNIKEFCNTYPNMTIRYVTHRIYSVKSNLIKGNSFGKVTDTYVLEQLCRSFFKDKTVTIPVD